MEKMKHQDVSTWQALIVEPRDNAKSLEIQSEASPSNHQDEHQRELHVRAKRTINDIF